MVCEECKPEFDKLIKRIEELEKKLLAYENANTPSSKIRFPPKILNQDKKKPGQKEGDEGATTIMERINSCIATWKQRGLNPFTELKAQLC